jgi:hypothetical protein
VRQELKHMMLPVVYGGVVLGKMSQTPLFHYRYLNETAIENFMEFVNLLRAGYCRVQLTFSKEFEKDDVASGRNDLIAMLREVSLPGESFAVTEVGQGEALFLYSLTRNVEDNALSTARAINFDARPSTLVIPQDGVSKNLRTLANSVLRYAEDSGRATTIRDLCMMTEWEAGRLRLCGPKTLELIKKALASHGLRFSMSPEELS